jgi:hypothetical protein
MKILVFNNTIAYVVASTHTGQRPFRAMGNLVGETHNETVNIGLAFTAAPLNVKQPHYDGARKLLIRGVRILDCEIINRDEFTEEDQAKLLADLWTGKPVEGFP